MKKIIVPPGEDGDEVLKRMIPNLHKMARGERNETTTRTSVNSDS